MTSPHNYLACSPTSIEHSLYLLRKCTEGHPFFCVIFTPRWEIMQQPLEYDKQVRQGYPALFFVADPTMENPYEWHIVAYDSSTKEPLAYIEYREGGDALSGPL